MDATTAEAILRELADQSEDVRRLVFSTLRKEFGLHPLESRLGVPAETILEAIDRSSDLTVRGIRGVIAEAVFKQEVLPHVAANGWNERPAPDNSAYDFLLARHDNEVRIQIKMQRQKAQRPMMAREASRKVLGDCANSWVVETQRTRGGRDNHGNSTRPYRFEEFDILGVALQPATGDWGRFMYTLSRWLIPSPENTSLIFKYQPVPKSPTDDWTDSLGEALQWFQDVENGQTHCS